MLARHRSLLRKSVAAMIAAIEIYNKPDFKYREETFSILAANAWELLLKAFVLKHSNNKLAPLYVREHRTLKSGDKSKRTYVKKNRSGNPMTIGWRKAVNIIESRGWHRFQETVLANLEGLQEIRNNAVHLANYNSRISELVQQLGSANVVNFVKLVREWFDEDLGQYDFYLMPLAFFRDSSRSTMIHLTSGEQRVIDTILSLYQGSKRGDGDYQMLFEMEVRLKSSSDPAAVRLARGSDENAVPVFLEEEDVRERYPWDYRTLTNRLKSRYSDFKENKQYHGVRKSLEGDSRYALPRFLDPGNPRSAKKVFFGAGILNEFDKHYTKRAN